MLEDYARRNGFPNPTHFTDDGISGTRFDRPGFTAMMEGRGWARGGHYREGYEPPGKGLPQSRSGDGNSSAARRPPDRHQ